MKKLLFFFFVLFYSMQTYANVDFLAKKTSYWDENYTSNLEWVSVNSSVTFQITTLGNGTTKNFNVNFWTGFVFNGYSIDGNCTFSLVWSTNNNFSYNFWGSNMCVSQIEFIYTPIASGNKSVGLIYNSSIINSVDVSVTNNNSIIKAKTKDTNNNGYLDAYELTFSSNITVLNDISSLTIGGINANSYVGNSSSWLLYFNDNIFNTWEIPQILSSATSFWNIPVLTNNSIIEEDFAAPIALKYNNQNIGTWLLYLKNGSNEFDFSEFLHPGSSNYFEVRKSNNFYSETFVLSGSKLTFTPNIAYSIWNYTFQALSGSKDYSSNGNGLSGLTKTLVLTWNIISNCTGLPSNASWNSVSSISQYWDWISFTPSSTIWVYSTTPSTIYCRFQCNTNFNWNGSSCISSSSWWGWGWWWGGGWWGWGWATPTTCTDSMLECKAYLWGYVYFRKAWVNCTGWNLAKTCSINPITSSGTTTNTGTSSSGNTSNSWWNTTGNIISNNLDEIKTYLISLSPNTKIVTMIESSYLEIVSVRNDYYLKINPTYRNNYNIVLENYKSYFLALINYYKTKDAKYLTESKAKNTLYVISINNLKNPENLYITKNFRNGFVMYDSNNEKLKIVLPKIENILFKKYNSLFTKTKINYETYSKTVENYNNFVLYLSIFKATKDPESKTKGKYFLGEIIKIYSLK